MGRIIDKITARRRKYERERSLNNHHQHDDDPNHPPNDHGDANASLPLGWFYSFEFYPPKTEAGVDNLLTRIDRMAERLDPLFINVTWGDSAFSSTAVRSLAVASHAQKYLGVDVLLHLTAAACATREQLAQILSQAKASGICNILALRGDPPRGQRAWNVGETAGGCCPRAIDLVKLIRDLHGDYFGIAVAGHPEGHPSSESQDEEMRHLKEKMDAGADLIITQFFYEPLLFLDFVRRCRSVGLDCPIIPGIMPIQSYSVLKRMTDYCQIAVPDQLWERLEPVKGDDEAVKDIGCQVAADMCRTILTAADADPNNKELGILDGVHFCTLNLERSVNNILIMMGAVNLILQPAVEAASDGASSSLSSSLQPQPSQSSVSVNNTDTAVRTTAGRVLPWRPSAMEKRSKDEQVRPINWANRPKSYVMRTEDWDEFPNGRWGDSTSPAFGELSNLGHFYAFSLGSDDDQRAMLGENPTTPSDVFEVFAKYVEGKIPHIPWCETRLQPESFLIQPQLSRLNRAGFLTINSQPAVNGVPSTHGTFGWGPSRGGFVYQKAYCECFCSPENMQKLVELTRRRPSLNLYAVNMAGDEIQQGVESGGVTALTWGVFPNREILQPTIFDPSTFLVWAEEAFALWTSMWLNLYEFDSQSYELIEGIRDTYYLCAVVDNDFTSQQDGRAIWDAMESIASG